MIIQDLPLNQDNYTFSLEKAKPPADGTAQEQTVFSAVTVKNRLSSLKSGFPSEPLDAKQSVSGQVPCFLSLGCSPRGNPLSSDSHEGVTLSPSHSYQDFFFEQRTQIAGFTSTTQKALKLQIGGMAQGRAVCVFWCPHRPTKACATLILASVVASITRPALACICGFLVR